MLRIADHLGTPRVWFTDVNDDGVIRAEDDVLETRTTYPFGMFAFGTKADGHTSDRRSFTGHESVGATDDPSSRYQGVIDMKARTYLPGLGIFAQVDHSASSHPNVSPYAYVNNDPVNNIDPDGEDVVPIVFPDYLIQTPFGKVPGLGHAGVLLIDNATGTTK